MKLATLPLVVLLAMVSWAGGQITEGQWTYIVENGGATITASTATGDVIIPSELDGYAVKKVGNRSPSIFGIPNTSVTSITIPDSVTSIGGSAFQECTSLTGVIIPNSVTSIGQYAFYGCTGLTADLTIPNSVTSIERYAFDSCTGLTSVSIPDSVTRIGVLAFAYCTGLTSVDIPSRFTAQIGAIGFTGQLATDLMADGLVEAITQRVLAALPNNYGIATKADLGTAVSDATSQAIAQVQAAPNDYNLFSPTQYQANRITGVAEGKAEVTSNPTAYSLFTESSIMDMNLGSLMLKKRADANALDLELTIETKDNLTTDGWQVAERITRLVSMVGVQRQFLRVRADAPYVAPDVEVLAHPTLGNILTDGAGRVLYYFAADTPGGNPLFSGSSWPYITVPPAPKADAGVSAMLASSAFGKPGGPYLTVNARPVYTYVGDAEAGQANGQGAGSVWWTIKVDGAINQ